MVGGRLNEAKRDTNSPDSAERADLREAYERGRRDERGARKRHPVLMTFLFVAAAVGAIVLALAAVNGSFTGAGGVVDQNLNIAAQNAEPVVRQAADNAGDQLRDAGQTVKAKASDAVNTTEPAPNAASGAATTTTTTTTPADTAG
jgi:hypothetical protein